jgi:hypothetical protein
MIVSRVVSLEANLLIVIEPCEVPLSHTTGREKRRIEIIIRELLALSQRILRTACGQTNRLLKFSLAEGFCACKFTYDS